MNRLKKTKVLIESDQNISQIEKRIRHDKIK